MTNRENDKKPCRPIRVRLTQHQLCQLLTAARVRLPDGTVGVVKDLRRLTKGIPMKLVLSHFSRHVATIEAEATVGRSHECNIRPGLSNVSRRHARLYQQDGAWHVEDLGSMNGTFVNGERVVSPSPLMHGDVLTFATTPYHVSICA